MLLQTSRRRRRKDFGRNRVGTKVGNVFEPVILTLGTQSGRVIAIEDKIWKCIGLALRGKYSKFVLQRVRGIRDLFLILFFVSIGTLIDPISAFALPFVLVGIILIGVFSKLAGAYVAGSLFATGLGGSAFAIWLLPRGEFSLIIAQSAFNAGIISIGIFSIIGILVILTALFGPVYLVRKSDDGRARSEFPTRPKSD